MPDDCWWEVTMAHEAGHAVALAAGLDEIRDLTARDVDGGATAMTREAMSVYKPLFDDLQMASLPLVQRPALLGRTRIGQDDLLGSRPIVK